jgi:hypothetical protein
MTRHLEQEDLTDLERIIESKFRQLKEGIMAEIDDATARIIESADRALAKITELEAQIANEGNPANAATLNAEADKLDAAAPPV